MRGSSSRVRRATLRRDGVARARTAAGFVRSLAGARNLGKQLARVDRMAAAGEWQRLLEISLAIEDLGGSLEIDRWALKTVFDQIVRALALSPAPDNARAALCIVEIERVHSWPPSPAYDAMVAARNAAGMLAQRQDAETCFELLGEAPNEVASEGLACWLQELVIRGVDVNRPEVAEFWDTVRARRHPLGALPLVRMDSEVGLAEVLPHLQLRGSSGALPFGPLAGEAGGKLGVAIRFRELDPPAGASTVVENWFEESNGRSEARLFEVDELPGRLTAGVLAQLPLVCLEDAKSILVRAISPAECTVILFAAAANGGAYNSGRRAAYGRLDLWISLAALSGAENGSVAEIEEALRASSLHQFSAASEWFQRVAWDIGIACVRPDRRAVAVLAATDTD